MVTRSFLILAFMAMVLTGIGFSMPRCAADPGAIDTKQIVQKPLSDAPSYTKRALVIGVDNYEHVAKLSDCSNDARDFAQMLKTKFGFDNITVMTDDPDTPEELKPTYTHILYQLRVLKDGIIAGQTQVVLFYSGHGTRTQNGATGDADWLIPLDGDAHDVTETCVNYTAFKADLDTRRPARALLVMDACRDIDPAKGPNVGSGFGEKHGFLGPQIAELLSCQPTQVSHEGKPEDFHESVFTHFLIAGMEGDKNAVDPDKHEVTFDSLMQFVQGKVSDYVTRQFAGDIQIPDGDAKLGSMVLAMSQAPIGPEPYVSSQGYQIIPAAGWKIDSSGILGTDLFLLAPRVGDFTPNLNIVVTTPSKGETLESIRDQGNSALAQELTDFKVVSQGFTAVDGARGIDTIAQHKGQNGDEQLYMHQITVINNGRAYIFTYTAGDSNHTKYDPDFSGMINSIKWQAPSDGPASAN